MNPKSKKILLTVKEYLLIALGLLLYVIGASLFFAPNQLVGGGVTGFDLILYYWFKIPLDISFFVINLVLIVMGLKVLGKSFAIKTIYGALVGTLFFRILSVEHLQAWVPKIIDLLSLSNGPLVAGILGGICCGIGIGITFTQGGSTGGTDIIALMINKYRRISPGKIILAIDIFIIGLSLLCPIQPSDTVVEGGFSFSSMGDSFDVRMVRMLYGYVITFVVGTTLDMYLSFEQQSMQIFIFSKKYAEIADAISNKIGRGVTVLNGQGWFTKADGKILMVVIKKYEVSQLYDEIREIDPNAFLSVNNAKGVYGQGFDTIKK